MTRDEEIKEARELQKAIELITDREPFLLLRLDRHKQELKMTGNINDKTFNIHLIMAALEKFRSSGGFMEDIPSK